MGRAAPSWTPGGLTGLIFHYEASPAYCFSDAAGTVPCALNEGVQVWRPKYAGTGGGGFFNQASLVDRPILTQDGAGRWVVRFDGVSDNLQHATFAATPKLWCFCVNRISNTGNFSGISNIHTQLGGGGDADCIRTNSDTTYRGHNAGVAVNSGDTNDFDTGDTFWVNKVAAAAFVMNTPHVVTSQRGTPNLYDRIIIGRRGAAGDRLWNGDMYGFTGTSATLSAAERGKLETYDGSLAGLFL